MNMQMQSCESIEELGSLLSAKLTSLAAHGVEYMSSVVTLPVGEGDLAWDVQ